MSSGSIPFADHGSVQQSGYEGGPRILAGTDPAPFRLGEVSRVEGRLYIAVFAGSQRTGGYGIRVAGVDRAADTLTVRALFSVPAPDALTIQVLTSPAHLVSIERRYVGEVQDMVLVDQSGARRAHGTVPQSQP